MGRAGAINEVVKLNLAVFARAASVHLSLSLSRSIVSRPISLADRNQLSPSPSPFHATGLRNPFILPSFLPSFPSMSFSSAAHSSSLISPFFAAAVGRRTGGVTHSPLFMRCRNKCPTETHARTSDAPSSSKSFRQRTLSFARYPDDADYFAFYRCR